MKDQNPPLWWSHLFRYDFLQKLPAMWIISLWKSRYWHSSNMLQKRFFFCLFKRTSVVWVSPRPGSLMEARQGLTQGSRGGTVQKAVLINGVNSCSNIYLFAPSPVEHWLILRILKTEVFIIDIRSNTFKVRSNGNFMCLLLCMCIQPITKMNYSSYEKKSSTFFHYNQ